MKLYDLKVGDRVRLTDFVDNFPFVLATPGETGVVATIQEDYAFVKMDRHFKELDDWDNELQVWRWDDNTVPLEKRED